MCPKPQAPLAAISTGLTGLELVHEGVEMGAFGRLRNQDLFVGQAHAHSSLSQE